jgi:hypothetical protein
MAISLSVGCGLMEKEGFLILPWATTRTSTGTCAFSTIISGQSGIFLGDLPAPATPNNKITSSVLAQEKLGWRLGLTAWTFKDLTLLETIDKAAELGIWYMDGLNVQKVSADIDKNFDYNLSREELMVIRAKLIEKGWLSPTTTSTIYRLMKKSVSRFLSLGR